MIAHTSVKEFTMNEFFRKLCALPSLAGRGRRLTRKCRHKPRPAQLQVEALEDRVVPAAPVPLPVAGTGLANIRVLPSYQVPASANGPANYFQQELGLYRPAAITDMASNGWITALTTQSSLSAIAGQVISQTTQSVDNMSLLGVNLGFNVDANNPSYSINQTQGWANVDTDHLNLKFNVLPYTGNGDGSDVYAGLDQANNTLWLEYVVHNNTASVHVDVGAGWEGVLPALVAATVAVGGPLAWPGAVAWEGLSWVPATGVDIGLTFDSVVVVGVQLPSHPTAGAKANYVSLGNKTDYADVFKDLQGLPNTQLNVVAAVSETNVQVSDDNAAANAINDLSFGAFNSLIANKVESQAPTDIAKQLQAGGTFDATQSQFNAFGDAGLSTARYSATTEELDMNLQQESHDITLGVGQIQDPYTVGGSGRYYDQVATYFDEYNNLAPYNKAAWVGAQGGNAVYDVNMDPWFADGVNDIESPTDNTFFDATRNGRPGKDIMQDLLQTAGVPKTGDYTVAMEVDLWRVDTVTPQQAGGVTHSQPDDQGFEYFTNKYPQAGGGFRALYITYDLGTGQISGYTADGVSFSGQEGQSIYVNANGNDPALSFTVGLDKAVDPKSLPSAVGTNFGSLVQALGLGGAQAPPPAGHVVNLGSLLALQSGGVSSPSSKSALTAFAAAYSLWSSNPVGASAGLNASAILTLANSAASTPATPLLAAAVVPSTPPSPLPYGVVHQDQGALWSAAFELPFVAVNPQPLPPG
jgi:hypothetical protein